MTRLRRLLSSPVIWLMLSLSYAASPRIATVTVWNDLVRPSQYRPKAFDISAVKRMGNGDLLACVNLSMRPGDEPVHRSIPLPFGKAEVAGGAATKMNGYVVGKRGQPFELLLNDRTWAIGCDSFEHQWAVVYLLPGTIDEPVYADFPTQPDTELELLIGTRSIASGWRSSILLLSRRPIRTVWYAASHERGEEVADEHYVEYVFPQQSTGVRWWAVPLFAIAVPVDAITGPLGWLLALNN